MDAKLFLAGLKEERKELVSKLKTLDRTISFMSPAPLKAGKSSKKAKGKGKGHVVSAEARAKMAKAQRERWAAKKANAELFTNEPEPTKATE
jgi:hypothetical protein